MNNNPIVSALPIVTGLAVFFSGCVGLRRLPDVSARLHALTRANDFGPGVAGMVSLASSAVYAVTRRFACVLVSSSASTYSMTQSERR